MKYGYARVSTVGQSLEAQEQELIDNGAEIIYKDKFTGTKLDRPEFTKLLGVLKSGDTLIVTKLDRFSRSVGQAAEVITQLVDNGITVDVLNLGKLSNDSVNTLLRNVLLSFAQFERDMIVQRTQEGKAIARQKEGYREGRPQLEVPRFKEFKKMVDEGRISVVEAVEELGISRSKWYSLVRREI